MHHIGTVTASSKFTQHTAHAQCSCGTAGYFPNKEEAVSYLQFHFSKLGGMSSAELLDKFDEPEAPEALPTTHIGGVGNMPASHATQPGEAPPPPPPPPNAGEDVALEGSESSTEPAPEGGWKKKKK
jgi:hypothetical protein